MCILTLNTETQKITQKCWKRFGHYYEPVEGEKINISLMRCITGYDSIKPRKLYLNPYFDGNKKKQIKNKK
jgi:hypothetical protein